MKTVLFLLLFVSNFVFSQKLKPVTNIPLTADSFIGFDSYKNLYFIEGMVLHKNGNDGEYVFNDYQLGRITSVDIINPLKVVVFYESTNTVVFLDNKLNEIERISFNRLTEFTNVSTATNAGNNRLWIFNVDTQQLELYNYKTLTKTVVSQPFKGKLLSQASNFNYCFVLTEHKLRTFNIYGSILSEKDANNFTKIVQQDEQLLALKDNELYYIPAEVGNKNNLLHGIFKLNTSEITIKELQLKQDFLYIYDGKTIHTFTLTLPKK